MMPEDIRLHLILGGMQAGHLRDKLFAEKALSMKKLLEVTSLFEEAELKKNNKASGQAKRVAGQGDKGGDELKCFKCDSTNHLKKDCPQIPKCSWCGRQFHKEADCYAKARGEPKT